MGRQLLLLFLAALLPLACRKAAADSGSVPAAEAPHAVHAEAGAKPEEEGKAEGHGAKHAEMNRSFALPFVRDPETEDPMEQARNLLHEFTGDNTAFMRQHDVKFFKAFADTQRPRATLITCSDSRVQSPALDTTPENDLFTIRNIGNQIATSEGSVEYGVEHLKTPLLFILGHTGCGAIKGALGDTASQPPAIRRELATIDLSPIGPKAEKTEARAERRAEGEKRQAITDQAWIDAVVVNVHHQVAAALERFAEQVSARDLIVVGAVYDFRNDLRKGYGSVQIVNVNGHTDPAKMTAFLKALETAGPDVPERTARAPATRRPASAAADVHGGR